MFSHAIMMLLLVNCGYDDVLGFVLVQKDQTEKLRLIFQKRKKKRKENVIA